MLSFPVMVPHTVYAWAKSLKIQYYLHPDSSLVETADGLARGRFVNIEDSQLFVQPPTRVFNTFLWTIKLWRPEKDLSVASCWLSLYSLLRFVNKMEVCDTGSAGLLNTWSGSWRKESAILLGASVITKVLKKQWRNSVFFEMAPPTKLIFVGTCTHGVYQALWKRVPGDEARAWASCKACTLC
jgi:hypothetical protein